MQTFSESDLELLEENYNSMRNCLQQIVDCFEFRSELYISDWDCAANLRDHAFKTLQSLNKLPEGVLGK